MFGLAPKRFRTPISEVISELKFVREPSERISGGPYCFEICKLYERSKKWQLFSKLLVPMPFWALKNSKSDPLPC